MSKSRDIADSAATINYIDNVTSDVQTQLNTLDTALDNISVTSGTLTKTFTNGETASISLTSNVLVPVVSVTKEVPQSGATNNTWDVNSTTENYTRLNSAPATTLNWNGNLATASYTRAFSVASQDIQPSAVAFNTTGTKMFHTGNANDRVYEYNLSTAFNVSSASFVDSFSVNSQETAPMGLAFNTDGTRMFVNGESSNTVYQYALSTGFDVSTASYTQGFSTAAQDSASNGVTFNTDGTKMFVTGESTKKINEYTLSSAFDVSTASYVDGFSVASQSTQPKDTQFNSDGTEMYVVSRSPATAVYKYTLTTGFDVSTASYANLAFSIANEETSPQGLAFSADSSKMYVCGFTGQDVNEYSLPLLLSLGSGSFASADVGKTIEANSGVFVLTAATGSYVQTTTPTSFNQVASGSWGMFGVVYNTTDGDLELSGYVNGFDLSAASYDSVSFSFSSQLTGSQGFALSADGTKMYIVEAGADTGYQFNLTTAFDISTASYAAKSFSFSSQDGIPRDLAVNSTGTKLFMLGGSNSRVYQYTLSIAGDLSTASYDSVSFLVSSQGASMRGLAFSNDGTKMYGIDSNIFQYTLTTAFDLSTASYASKTFNFATQDTGVNSVAFNADGTKMFGVGTTNDTVYQYTLSTAFDVSTASYNSVSFSVASQDTTPLGIAFNTAGTTMLILGTVNSSIYQYTTGSVSAPTGYQPVHTTASTDTEYWTDINSMTANQAAGDGNVYYAISTDDRTTWSVIDNTDGERDIVRNNSGTWQYNSNGTYASETWVNGATNTELATIAESMEGASAVAQKYNISTAVFVDNFSVNSQDTSPYGFSFSSTGHKMYVVGITNDSVYEYALSTVFDVSTASYTASFSVAAQDTSPTDVVLSTDGTKMFVLGDTGNDVNEYSLSNAYDVSSASFVDSFSVAAQESDPWGLAFNPTGTKMFVLGYGTDTVREYTLSNGFDVSTASYSQGFSVAAQDTVVTGVDFSADGTKMFVLGNQTRDIFQYSLSAGFDVSTASYVRTFEVNIAGVAKVRMNNDGTKMFTINYSSKNVGEYTVGTTAYINQMDKTQLDAVTDPNHIALGDDFDLSIILNMTSGTTVPSSNGVAINYDANILNKGAVLGTDYDFDAPAQNKVRITALAGNNLKVRVV